MRTIMQAIISLLAFNLIFSSFVFGIEKLSAEDERLIKMYGKPVREISDTKNDVFYQTGSPNMPLLCARQIIVHYKGIKNATNFNFDNIYYKKPQCERVKLKTKDAKIKELLRRSTIYFLIHSPSRYPCTSPIQELPKLEQYGVSLYEAIKALKRKYGIFVQGEHKCQGLDDSMEITKLNGLDATFDYGMKKYNSSRLSDNVEHMTVNFLERYKINSSPTIIARMKDTATWIVITRQYIEGQALEDALEKAADKIIHELEWRPSEDFCIWNC